METYKTVKNSQTTLTELMIPSYSNFGGKVHGGVILGLMDKVAYACAAKHAGNYCVTVSIDTVNFMAPVEVGELVSLLASVNYVGNSSMVIGIRVQTENVKTQEIKHTNSSYFTMVAMGDDHMPVQVPGLILQNQTEIKRFYEAYHRKELTRYYDQEQNRIKNADEMEEAIKLLGQERCRVELIDTTA
ncbi:acyl-CoA thioesterase [Mucilaginibacter sp. PAMB04168]|uniref:acyl-CoA thioesterase n=1 Tax=Mucilaginibacter sp. PAMB04168 TaxID=3138567 RepID=UPI0031F6C1F7